MNSLQELKRLMDDENLALTADGGRWVLTEMQEHEDGGAMWRNGPKCVAIEVDLEDVLAQAKAFFKR